MNEALFRLIDRIYEGATDPGAWPDFVQRAADFMQTPKARLFTPLSSPAQGGLGISVGIPQAALEVWARKYMEHDIWVERGVAKGLLVEGFVGLDSDLVPPREFEQSVIYREHLQHLGVGRLCVGVIFGTTTPGMLPTVLAVYRDFAHAFDAEEAAGMRVLVPHLSRALGVMYRLRDAELKLAASRAALDELPVAIVLIGAQGAVLHANATARQLLEPGDGLRLAGEAGRAPRLHACDPVADARLAGTLAAALRRDVLEAPHFSSTLTVPRGGRSPLSLQAAPLPDSNPFSGDTRTASAIVFINDPEADVALDERLLDELFHITPAEARLAQRLVAGQCLKDASAECGISLTTAKTHLSALFHKTGVARQAELVRLLASTATRP
jgi:DNA-binding CsgD family transcriptional regulator